MKYAIERLIKKGWLIEYIQYDNQNIGQDNNKGHMIEEEMFPP